MRTTRNIQSRIVQLEQRLLPESNKSYICYVETGADRDEVVDRFCQDNNVQKGDILHVVKFVSAEKVKDRN